MISKSVEAYVASLPEVETARLSRGALFVADGRIYQVIETGTGGFAKARQWRRDESTDVALVAGSFLTKYLPLVRVGRLLPVYRSRTELTEDGQTCYFVFPTETFALDAAYLDVALIMSAGAYVRNHNHEPAFAVTDGVHIFRLYYYLRSVRGRPTTIASHGIEHPHCQLRPHTEGPAYWRVLPSWQDSFPPAHVTQQVSTAVVKQVRATASPSDTTQTQQSTNAVSPLQSDDDTDADKTHPNIRRR
jgi:hypothetical protein